MFMVKVSALLAVYFLLISQTYSSHAAPRPAADTVTDALALSDYEAGRLIKVLVRELVQMTSEEQSDGNSVSLQKRACNTATCVTHRLADFLSRSGGMSSSSFVPTNVGSKAFGRRRRTGNM